LVKLNSDIMVAIVKTGDHFNLAWHIILFCSHSETAC